MNEAIADLGLMLLPITVEHADAQAGLPRHHGDPFDRLLVAQAQVENISLVSADQVFDQYGVHRIWR
jgi:PIN domain nuclease of toxin-antitoxin system